MSLWVIRYRCIPRQFRPMSAMHPIADIASAVQKQKRPPTEAASEYFSYQRSRGTASLAIIAPQAKMKHWPPTKVVYSPQLDFQLWVGNAR
jgi:hypothetical protein